MPPRNPVEFADRLSRKKSFAVAFAGIWFLAIQPFTHPDFTTGGGARAVGWVLNATVLLLLLLPIAGFMWGRRVRELINDDVSRMHAHAAMAAGFWTAMGVGLGLFVLPLSEGLSARESIYYIVTASTACALLRFAWLEWRANHG